MMLEIMLQKAHAVKEYFLGNIKGPKGDKGTQRWQGYTGVTGIIPQNELNKIVNTVSIANATQDMINFKVDKVMGKGLSTEDYTATEKQKLSNIEVGQK